MKFIEYLRKIHILYVEDDKVSNAMVSKLLKDFKYNTKSFYEPLLALNYFKDADNKVDLIISDIYMPKLNGIDFIKKIKDINSQTPVIFTTAFTDEKYLLEAISLGVNSYIKKPINFYDLKKAIDKALYPFYLESENEQQDRLIHQQSKDLLVAKTVSMISHQWKQPLTKISSIVSKLKVYLQMDEFNKEKFVQSLDKIEKENKYLASIINKFESVLKSKQYRHFGLKELIDYSLRILNNRKDSEVSIEKSITSNIYIVSDFNEFTTIVLSILTNSLENFERKRLDNQKIKISSYFENGDLYLSIKDNALGIEEQDIQKVFDLYYSNQELNKKGLGLYFVRLSLSLLVEGDVSLKNIEYNNRKGLETLIKIPQKYLSNKPDNLDYNI